MKSQANNIETSNKNCSDLHSTLNRVIFELLEDETSLHILQNKLMNTINIRYGDAIERNLRRDFKYRHLFNDHVLADSTSVKHVDEPDQNYASRSTKCITRNVPTVPSNTSCDIDKQYKKPILLLNANNNTNNELDQLKRVHGQVDRQKVIVEYSKNSFLAGPTEVESIVTKQDKIVPSKKQQLKNNHFRKAIKNSDKKENIDHSALISNKNKKKILKQNINNNFSQMKMLKYKPMEQVYEFKVTDDGVIPITKVENTNILKKMEKPKKDTSINLSEKSSKDDNNKSQTIWFKRSKVCTINRPKHNISSLKNIHEYFTINDSDDGVHMKDNYDTASEKKSEYQKKTPKANYVANITINNKYKIENNSEKTLDAIENHNISSIGRVLTSNHHQKINFSNQRKSINISPQKNIQSEEKKESLPERNIGNEEGTGPYKGVYSQIQSKGTLNTIKSDNSEFYGNENICSVDNLESNISPSKKNGNFFTSVKSDDDSDHENKLEVMNDNIPEKNIGDGKARIKTICKIKNSNSSNVNFNDHHENVEHQKVPIDKIIENVQMVQNEKIYKKDSTNVCDNNNNKSVALKEEIMTNIKNLLFSNDTAAKLQIKTYSKHPQEKSETKIQIEKEELNLNSISAEYNRKDLDIKATMLVDVSKGINAEDKMGDCPNLKSPVDIIDKTNSDKIKQMATLDSLNIIEKKNRDEEQQNPTLNSLNMIEEKNRDIEIDIINCKPDDSSIKDFEKTKYVNTTKSSQEGKGGHTLSEKSEVITEINENHFDNEMPRCWKHTNEIEYMTIPSEQEEQLKSNKSGTAQEKGITVTSRSNEESETTSQFEIQNEVEFEIRGANIQQKNITNTNKKNKGRSQAKIQKKVNCSQLYQFNDRSSAISNDNEIIDLTNISDENVPEVNNEMMLIRKENSNISHVPETCYSTAMRDMSKNTQNVLLKIVYKKDDKKSCVGNTECKKDKKIENNIKNMLTKQENELDKYKKVRQRVLGGNEESSFRRRYNLRSVSPEPKKKKMRRLFGHTEIVTRSRASLDSSKLTMISE